MSIDPSTAFHGFAAPDLDAIRTFYADVLGVEVTEDHGLLRLHLGGGTPTLVYPKPERAPASYTFLNFPVADVTSAVADLVGRGVVLEWYDGMPQDDDGVMRGNGPDIAWFTDPAGNVISVVQA
jgi:catechol 2,3-dioxygenase-like lactoylglutathione lyase family enzyme